jgi:hypothetical protein
MIPSYRNITTTLLTASSSYYFKAQFATSPYSNSFVYNMETKHNNRLAV